MKINKIYEIIPGAKGMDILSFQNTYFIRYHHVHYSCHINEGLASIIKETSSSGTHHFYICKQLDPSITIRIPTMTEIVKYLELEKESSFDVSEYINISDVYENENVKMIKIQYILIDRFVGVGSDGDFYTIDKVQNARGMIDCNSYVTYKDLSDDMWEKTSNLEELILSTFGHWRYITSDKWYADETTNTLIGEPIDLSHDSCIYYKYIKLYNERSIEFKILSSSIVNFKNVKTATSNLSEAFIKNRISDGYTWFLNTSENPELVYAKMGDPIPHVYAWKDAITYYSTKKERPERFADLVAIIEKSEKDFDEAIIRIGKSNLSMNERLRIIKEAKEKRNRIYTYTMK